MNNSIHILIVFLLTSAATCVLPGCSQSSTVDRDEPAITSVPSLDQDSTAIPREPAEGINTTDSQEGETSFEHRQLSEAELTRSSWQNPFRPTLWSCDGWRVDEDSMTSETESSHPATFLRPYRNVVIECRFSRNGEVDPPKDHPPIEFELRLFNRDTQRWTSLSHNSGKLTLSESGAEASSRQQPLRESTNAVNGDTQNLDVRLTVTPNRILVAINGQMRINSPRPTSILNAECLPQFVIYQPGVSLTDLRFEGD